VQSDVCMEVRSVKILMWWCSVSWESSSNVGGGKLMVEISSYLCINQIQSLALYSLLNAEVDYMTQTFA
jgi:hypothetical protein